MYYVYLLENEEDRSWYTGFTHDLKRRVADHNAGLGGKTTSKNRKWNLIYYEAYANKQDAIGREVFLKSGSGKKLLKKQLVQYFGVEK